MQALPPLAVLIASLAPWHGVQGTVLDSAPGRERPPAFVVLAPRAWLQALGPFVAARAKDLTVEAVALEDVFASAEGVDPPERIKRFLYAGWKERNVRYVLLVGDADTFPVRFMLLDRVTEPAFDHAFYPCDLYYADVADARGAYDGWNASAEGVHAGYFGEVHGEKHKDGPINHDRISYVPELAVGRWPVSDAAALDSVVRKTLAFRPPAPEKDPVAIFVHADGWVDERKRLAQLGERLTRAGFDVERQFYGGLQPTTESVEASLRSNRPLLVFHCGHGTADTWPGCLEDLTHVAKGTPAIYFSVGCNTAEFCCEPPYHPYLDTQLVRHAGTNAGEVFTAPPPPPACLQPGELNLTGIGERLLRMPAGGAVVYIGCATGAQPCAVTLLEGFSQAISDAPVRRAGDAWRLALEHYFVRERLAELAPDAGWYPPSIFFQGMKFLYFGDPTLRVGRG